MTHFVKEWLVRTRTGEILGPFTQKELGEELARKTFTVEDEIAKPLGKWVSAQSVAYREAEELTSTHTRNLSSINTTDHASETPTPTPVAPTDETHMAPNTEPVEATSKISNIKMVICLIAAALIGWGTTFFRESKKIAKNSSVPPANNSLIVQKVNAMIYAGETQRALRELTQYHKKASSDQELDYLIPYSALLITEGDSDGEAHKLLEKILETSTDKSAKAQAQLWFGFIQLKRGEGDLGESHFMESLQLNPKEAATCFNLAQAYLKQKKYNLALDFLNFAELTEPNLWLIHIYKGRAKFLMGNLEEARVSFKRAIESSPDRWIAHLYYSVFLDAIHENSEARRVINQMFRRDPEFDSNSPAPLGYFEEKVSYEEYLESYDHIMKTAPLGEKEVGRIYLNYLMQGAPTTSKRIEQLAEKNNELAKLISLKVALDQNLPAEVIKNRMDRIPQFPREMGYFVYVLRGQAKTRLGNLDGAKRDLSAAIALEPHSAIAHWALSVLLRRTQKNQEANDEIKNLLSYHPHYIPAIVSSQHF